MNRRDFLRYSIPVGTLPFMIGGFPIHAYGRSPLMDALAGFAIPNDRCLVLIQLNGGNDGLNMVIPLDQYAALTSVRSNILIPQASVLSLTTLTGLHPSMTGLASMYSNGELAIIQGVSYQNPNFSHFRATDIWLTGADYNQVLTTGAWGRYLDSEFSNYPTGYPNADAPDPLALCIGSVISPGLQGPNVSMGIAISNPNSQYILPGGSDVAPTTPAGHELSYIREVAQQTQVYSSSIKTASDKVTNKATYPTNNPLADQLKILARLVAGGLKTRIYVVNLGGFDTHSVQVDSTDHTKGTHATLLGHLSDAISTFINDLALLGVDNNVVGMTFSEFGRRIKSNASVGTDHGTALSMFVFGKPVNAGIVGTNPVLTNNSTGVVKDNLDMQFDFRTVYTSLLRDWLGASTAELQNTMITPLYTQVQNSLNLITPSAIADVKNPVLLPTQYELRQNYPNPFNPSTTVEYQLRRTSSILLEVYDTSGRRVAVLDEGIREPGVFRILFDASHLASGTYFCRLQFEGGSQTKKMVLLR